MVVFVTGVVIFGATYSHYNKNINAHEFETEFPRVMPAIIYYHYVDDCVNSFPTAEKVLKVDSEVKRIHDGG